MNDEGDVDGRCLLVLEAALLCSSQPLSISQLRQLFEPELPVPRGGNRPGSKRLSPGPG